MSDQNTVTANETMQSNIVKLIFNAIKVRDVVKLIEEYAQVCVPQQVKHMKTTWTKWWYEICDKQLCAEEVVLDLVKTSNKDNFPSWLSPRRDCGRIGYNFNANNKIVDQYINITSLNETDGSITTRITGLDKSIILIPHKYEELDSYNHYRTTSFDSKIQLESCSIQISVDVRQADDFDFKLTESKSIVGEEGKYFVKDKRLRELNNALQMLSDVYSPQDITDIISKTHSKLYRLKIENEHKQLLQLFAKLSVNISDNSNNWCKSYTNDDVETNVITGTHLFYIFDNGEAASYNCEETFELRYLEIGTIGSKTSFNTVINTLLNEMQKTYIGHYKVPIYYKMDTKILGGRLFFDGTGWRW